ncbi:hypothetical protein AK51_27685 [Serratia nematodiphila DZ0503SBS1]|nr:hypothetical protein AK51_27685 [Serratia nematodiphila DZ0503SBS1]
MLLAWRDREEVAQILSQIEFIRSTEHTLTSAAELLLVLERVREQGFGEDVEEQEAGIRCIAVPVFDRFGVAIAGLSISFPTLRFSDAAREEYVALLHVAAGAFPSSRAITTTRSDRHFDERGAAMAAPCCYFAPGVSR